MNPFDTRGWDWDHSDYSGAAVGDSGPWIWWLPLAWRAVADPLGAHPLPAAPLPLLPGEVNHADKHAYIVAWWAPLLHLLFFGSGWVRPDLGLARWLDLGQPDDDPVLRLVRRWWGPQVEDVLAWAGQLDTLAEISAVISAAVHATPKAARLPDRWAGRRRSPEWEGVWGGGDSLHLGYHVVTPVNAVHDQGARLVSASAASGPPHAVLMLSSYKGWYESLSRLGKALPVRTDSRSWRIDVVVRRLGWLGTYRRSRLTGRWFSCRHRWHELGIDAPLRL